jgi:HK97 family phage prohead protease
MARYDHINFTPPAGVRAEAKKGLAWRREFGRGGTAVGVARARDLSNGVDISPETARRIKAYFDRHEVDKQGQGFSPGEDGFPSNGRIAWALWGGDAGWAWAKKLLRQMDSANNDASRSDAMSYERRTLVLDDTPEPIIGIELRSEGGSEPQEFVSGYAALFGVNSLDLGDFIERIDATAFAIVSERRGRKKPLETRALWNHDPNFPLARYPGTLKLTVDERGLRYSFPVPDTSYGRDLASNIKAGIVRGSSFGFKVAKGGESWSSENGRSIRTVTAIEDLLDVSPTTFPAYPDSDVAVARRSFRAFRESVPRRHRPSASLRAWMRGREIA